MGTIKNIFVFRLQKPMQEEEDGLDGIPLSKDADDVDGIPFDEADDIDGVPINNGTF